MIKSYKHKGLEEFFYTGSKKGIKPSHSSKLSRILDRLNAANEIRDMNYPGSYLHQLSGDKKGQYVMARFNDTGPYALDNIKCITAEENHIEANKGNTYAADWRRTNGYN